MGSWIKNRDRKFKIYNGIYYIKKDGNYFPIFLKHLFLLFGRSLSLFFYVVLYSFIAYSVISPVSD
jgi:hypothetical protein